MGQGKKGLKICAHKAEMSPELQNQAKNLTATKRGMAACRSLSYDTEGEHNNCDYKRESRIKAIVPPAVVHGRVRDDWHEGAVIGILDPGKRDRVISCRYSINIWTLEAPSAYLRLPPFFGSNWGLGN